MAPDKSRRLIPSAALLLIICLVSAAFFSLLNQWDNKYTAKGPQPQNGLLTLEESALAEYPVLFLVSDWEIYRDRLLTPEDFKENPPLPDELVFIGQYGGLEGRVKEGISARSPHGSATYRLNIVLPVEIRNYTLELPEIYSTYRLYINGVLMKEMGNPDVDGYFAETGTSSVTVQASEHMEILIAVSDYGHFYSGMVYPPTFGEPSAVAELMNQRLALRTLSCAVALCVGFLYLLLGLFGGIRRKKGTGNALPFLYAALCLIFTLYICYPVVKALSTGGLALYRLETFAFCTMLLLILWIQDRLTGMDRRWTSIFAAFGVFTCAVSLAFPLLMGDSLNLMTAYSRLIGSYTWVCATYLTAGAVWALYHEKNHSRFMLAGIALFDTALVMDRIYPMFEPIRFGWFIEISGGVLVLCIGGAMAYEIAEQLRLRQAVEARAESVAKMLEVQRAYHPVLLEKEQEARATRHDLRHHITMLREFLEQDNMAGLRSYLDAYSDKEILTVPMSYCRHYVTDMLLRMYAGLAARQDTPFRVEARLPESLMIDDVDMCVVLSNLLENALEASLKLAPDERDVFVRIGCRHGRLILLIENRFDGQAQAENGRFFSRKKKGRLGVGLASVQAVVLRLGGNTNFRAERNIFYSEVFLPQRQEIEKTKEVECENCNM